jgi:hypothetical protein
MTDIGYALLSILNGVEDGRNWKQLQLELRHKDIQAHHGTISGALNALHKSGDVFYLKVLIDNCHPYVHKQYKNKYQASERVDKPRTSKWRNIADRLYDVMTDPDATNKDWKEALALYRENDND